MTNPAPILCERLDALSPGVVHGFFTRQGGVSEGIFSSLNTGFGSSDLHDDVAENRRRVADHMGAPGKPLATPHQTHSTDVIIVDESWDYENRPRADAVITKRPGIAIGVLTADCGPVLIAEPQARVVAAIHAGWRGALTGILENAIAAMERLGALRQRMTATLGPTIGKDNYEVGPEFVERFIEADRENARFLRPSPKEGHSLFDLPAYILSRLHAAGVDASWTGHCTYDDEARFFSYRRKTHRGEADYGRQISAIVIRD
ncbi:MAG: peptidoglycan editing factor PgeF [Salaquimonas sp.]|nr:peptidoglycan editing factor PgeF [Salaquimonas sp.]